MTNWQSLTGSVAIVGIGESDLISRSPDKSVLQLHAEAVRGALQDSGLDKENIDGVFTAGTPVATLTEYLGLKPRYFDGTSVGGCSFVVQIEHAMLALTNGMCDYALISHGESGRSRVGVLSGPPSPESPVGQFEAPFGTYGPTTTFSLPILRYLHTYGIPRERLADVAVSTRQWATLNPRATMREPITVEDVLQSPMICYPLTRLMCCLVTDAAGAVVLTTAERAKDMAKPPIYVLGTGEAVEHQMVSQMEDYNRSGAFEVSGSRAFAMAGIAHDDLDFAELYDAFVHTPLFALEALGFCGPGEGIGFFEDGRAAPKGEFPINTNGGGLSCTHPGMYGMFIILEAVRQLRGEAGARQVKSRRDPDSNASLGIVHGPGGMFSAAGTAILGNIIP
jgi:acetyl-CoA acetyltransferase